MEEIKRFNCHDGNFNSLCSQEFCSNPETHMIKINFNGIRIIIGLCEKHAEELENRISESVRNKFSLEKQLQEIRNG